MTDSDAPEELSLVTEAQAQLQDVQANLADDRPELAALLDEATTDLDAIAAVLEADNEEDETRWRATAADPEETPQQ